MGGTGYLGRALTDRLQRDGHWVRILDVRTGDLFCEYIQGDILSEADVNNNRGAAPRCIQNRLHEHDQYTGYAPSQDAVGDEDTPYNWGSLDVSYMETKREAEELVLRMVNEQNLPATIVNPATIFGGNDTTGMNASRYIGLIRAGQMPAYPTGGTNCVALENVVEGHVMASRKGRTRQLLVAENLTYKQLFDFIASELGVAAPAIPLVEGLNSVLANVAEKGFGLLGKEPPFTAEMSVLRAGFLFTATTKPAVNWAWCSKSFCLICKG
jgi:dihydroflavonol-4-reductase